MVGAERPSVQVVVDGWPWGEVRLVAWGRAPDGWYGLVVWHEHLYRAGEPDVNGRTIVASAWLPAARLHSRRPYDAPVPVHRVRLAQGQWPDDEVAHGGGLGYCHFGLLTARARPSVPGWVPYARRTV